MIVSFPSPPPNYQPSAIVQILDTIRRALINVVSSDEAVQRIMLRSPGGKVYQVTVSDTGVLTTALNDGKSRI